MPKLSAFTPLGILSLSAASSPARVIYDAKAAALGGNGVAYRIEPGSRMDALCYAQSIREAGIRRRLRFAGEQVWPDRVFDLLPDREIEYGLVPSAGDTIDERKGAFAAAMRLPGGAGLLNVEQSLRALLGDAFLGLRTTKPSEIAICPATLGAQPMNLVRSDVKRVTIRLRTAITATGAQSVIYDRIDPPSGDRQIHTLAVGDRVVVEPELAGRTEVVTVTATGFNIEDPTITAVFSQAHEAGAWGTTMPWPAWQSTQRAVLVIVASAAALDAETRRRTNELLQKLLRGVTTWAIVEATALHPTTIGPFKIGESPLGITPLGALTYP